MTVLFSIIPYPLQYYPVPQFPVRHLLQLPERRFRRLRRLRLVGLFQGFVAAILILPNQRRSSLLLTPHQGVRSIRTIVFDSEVSEKIVLTPYQGVRQTAEIAMLNYVNSIRHVGTRVVDNQSTPAHRPHILLRL